MRDFDYSDATEFLENFFRGAEHVVEIRALPNERSGGAKPLFGGDDSLKQAHCQTWDRAGWGVFFGCCTRLIGRPTGTRADLAELVALWCDIDCYKNGFSKEEVIRALKSCPIQPTIIVDSGGGIHAYWLLREPVDARLPESGSDAIKEEVDAVLKQLSGIFAGDRNVCEIARVMRLVGTHNTKSVAGATGGEMRPVKLVDASGPRWEFADLQSTLDWLGPILRAPVATEGRSERPAADNPFSEFAQRFAFKAPIDVRQRLDAMSHEAAGENSIHQTQLQVSASLIRQGLDDDEIVNLILDATHRAAGLAGERWNWKREEANLRRMIADWRKKLAREAPPPRPASTAATVVQLRGGGPKEAEDTHVESETETQLSAGGYVRNDIGNAMHLLALHGNALCYVVGLGWHIWDGKRYRADPEMIAAHRLAHDVSAEQLKIALRVADKDARKAESKWAVSSGTNARILAMLHQARSYVAHNSDDLDADVWLLNCQNGTLDLRTMALRPHAPADLCTKIVGTTYDPQATCPRWESFLVEIFDGDIEMVNFVQCALGYSLTGSNKENVFFILHGTGKNGKSRLLETISHVLGDYMQSTPADTWSAKPAGAPSNDIAALPGARLVTTNETEKNHSLREGLVKQVTGGDKVSARKMFHEFFEFTPQCKLWIATNNKPKVSGSDGAIWDRVRLLPFNVKFVPAAELVEGQKVRDNELMDKLLAELPGILAWMVRGCVEWQRSGLPPAVAMVEAASVYRASQDSVQGFIDECCDGTRGLTCAVKDLFSAYEIWCAENDEEPMPKKPFGTNLDERGYPAGKSGRIRMRKRIDLKGEWRTKVEQRGGDDRGT